MNRNEVSWCLSSSTLQPPPNRYPDPERVRLKQAIASWAGVFAENVLPTAGGDQLIEVFLLDCLLKGRRKIAIQTPSFDIFEGVAHRLKLDVLPLPLDENFEPISSEWDRTARRADAAIVCTPNNPSGNLIPRLAIERLAKRLKGPLLIDQAYLEFASDVAAADFATLALSRPQTVVLRTFSKAFGLAGLRVGYGLASVASNETLRSLILPFNVGSWAAEMAIDAIRKSDSLPSFLDELRNRRNQARNWLLNRPGVEAVFPSETNFLLVRGTSRVALEEALRPVRSRTRWFEAEFGERFARVTIDLQLDVERLAFDAALNEVVL